MALKVGSKGAQVRMVQTALRREGLDLDDDGDFGPDTEAAVEDFQNRNGLEVDGVVGPDTLAALGLDQATSDREELRFASDIAFEPEEVTTLPEQPVSVELPGGQRIQNRSEPASDDLVTVAGLGGKQVRLHHLAATYGFRLIGAARDDRLPDPLLLPVSGFRSQARQHELWQRALKKYGSEEAARKWVAKPGGSAHHSGRAVDCWLGTPVGSEHVSQQRQTPAWSWLVSNAERFGFYPYEAEPWHWEYNPPAN
jgi:hypothetical protein